MAVFADSTLGSQQGQKVCWVNDIMVGVRFRLNRSSKTITCWISLKESLQLYLSNFLFFARIWDGEANLWVFDNRLTMPRINRLTIKIELVIHHLVEGLSDPFSRFFLPMSIILKHFERKSTSFCSLTDLFSMVGEGIWWPLRLLVPTLGNDHGWICLWNKVYK